MCVIVFDLYLLWDWISQFSRGTNPTCVRNNCSFFWFIRFLQVQTTNSNNTFQNQANNITQHNQPAHRTPAVIIKYTQTNITNTEDWTWSLHRYWYHNLQRDIQHISNHLHTFRKPFQIKLFHNLQRDIHTSASQISLTFRKTLSIKLLFEVIPLNKIHCKTVLPINHGTTFTCHFWNIRPTRCNLYLVPHTKCYKQRPKSSQNTNTQSKRSIPNYVAALYQLQ